MSDELLDVHQDWLKQAENFYKIADKRMLATVREGMDITCLQREYATLVSDLVTDDPELNFDQYIELKTSIPADLKKEFNTDDQYIFALLKNPLLKLFANIYGMLQGRTYAEVAKAESAESCDLMLKASLITAFPKTALKAGLSLPESACYECTHLHLAKWAKVHGLENENDFKKLQERLKFLNLALVFHILKTIIESETDAPKTNSLKKQLQIIKRLNEFLDQQAANTLKKTKSSLSQDEAGNKIGFILSNDKIDEKLVSDFYENDYPRLTAHQQSYLNNLLQKKTQEKQISSEMQNTCLAKAHYHTNNTSTRLNNFLMRYKSMHWSWKALTIASIVVIAGAATAGTIFTGGLLLPIAIAAGAAVTAIVAGHVAHIFKQPIIYTKAVKPETLLSSTQSPQEDSKLIEGFTVSETVAAANALDKDHAETSTSALGQVVAIAGIFKPRAADTTDNVQKSSEAIFTPTN